MRITARGDVFDCVPDYKGQLLVLQDDGGHVAVRVWEGHKLLKPESYKRGDTVEASGKLSSREHKGKWYTQFEADELRLIRSAKPAANAKDDDDDIAF